MILKVDEDLQEVINHFSQRQENLNTTLFKVMGKYYGVDDETIPHLVLVRTPKGAILFDDRTHKVEGDSIVEIVKPPLVSEPPPELSPNEEPPPELEDVAQNFMRPSKVSYKKKEQ